MRCLAVVGLSALATFSLAAPPAKIWGTWVPDASRGPLKFYEKGLQITLRKDGTMIFRGFNVSGSGTYRVQGNRIMFVLTSRGGVRPTNPRERQGAAQLVEGGRAMLIPTGETERGHAVTTRLVREKG